MKSVTIEDNPILDIETWEKISVYALEIRDIMEQDFSIELIREVERINRKNILRLIKGR